MKHIYSILFVLLCAGSVNAQVYSGTIKHGITKSTYFVASIVPSASNAAVQFTNIDITIRIPHQAGNVNSGVGFQNAVPFTQPSLVIVQNFTGLPATQNDANQMWTDGVWDYYVIALTGAVWNTSVSAGTAKDVLELKFTGLNPNVTASPQLIDYATGPAGAGGPGFTTYFYVETNNGDQTNYANMMVNGTDGVGAFNSSIGSNTGFTRIGISFVGLDAPVPLPTKLSAFNVKKADDRRAQINWQTTNEQNTDYFEVERSLDGKNFDKMVRRTVAAGNSNGLLDYQTYDNEPAYGNNYYRLKSVDQSGKFTYSEIRVANFGTDRSYSLSPNPASDIVNVKGMEAGAKVMVMSTTGQRVSETTATSSVETINVSNLVPGIYYIQVIENGAIVYNAKFNKQ